MRYTKFPAYFWTTGPGYTYRGTPHVLAVILYLWTCPGSHSTGVYRVTAGNVAHSLGIPERKVEDAFQVLQRDQEITHNASAGIVWVHGVVIAEWGDRLADGDKRRKAARTHMETLGDYPIVAAWWKIHGETHGLGNCPALGKALQVDLPYDATEGPCPSPLPKPLAQAPSPRGIPKDLTEGPSLSPLPKDLTHAPPEGPSAQYAQRTTHNAGFPDASAGVPACDAHTVGAPTRAVNLPLVFEEADPWGLTPQPEPPSAATPPDQDGPIEPDPDPPPVPEEIPPATGQPEAIPGSDPDDEDDEPAPAAPTTSKERYAAAYSAGIRAATGMPHAIPVARAEEQALGRLIQTHSEGRRKTALLDWIRETAEAYVRARPDGTYERGYAPSKCLDWVNTGRPTRGGPQRVSSAAAQQGYAPHVEKLIKEAGF